MQCLSPSNTAVRHMQFDGHVDNVIPSGIFWKTLAEYWFGEVICWKCVKRKMKIVFCLSVVLEGRMKAVLSIYLYYSWWE